MKEEKKEKRNQIEPSGSKLTKKEKEIIKERLRQLGYLMVFI